MSKLGLKEIRCWAPLCSAILCLLDSYPCLCKSLIVFEKRCVSWCSLSKSGCAHQSRLIFCELPPHHSHCQGWKWSVLTTHVCWSTWTTLGMRFVLMKIRIITSCRILHLRTPVYTIHEQRRHQLTCVTCNVLYNIALCPSSTANA